MSSAIVKPKAPVQKPKLSLLSRAVHKLVPCAGPSQMHTNDDAGSVKSDPNSSVAAKDITGIKEAEVDPHLPQPHASPDNNAPSDHPIASTSAPLVVPPITNHSLPPTDPEVIIPPPPSTHLLPEAVTDGVTSGAVQPPGSTGGEIVRTHSRDSASESDETNVTDEGVDDNHTMEDEEERLIKNGGAGIPMGPVCDSDVVNVNRGF